MIDQVRYLKDVVILEAFSVSIKNLTIETISLFEEPLNKSVHLIKI